MAWKSDRPLPELLWTGRDWTGGREKAPAAICRKIAEAEDGGTIEAWGTGPRSVLYLYRRHAGRHLSPDALGDQGPHEHRCPQYVSVKELVDTVARVAGKKINVKWIKGPVGVSRGISATTRSIPWLEIKIFIEGRAKL